MNELQFHLRMYHLPPCTCHQPDLIQPETHPRPQASSAPEPPPLSPGSSWPWNSPSRETLRGSCCPDLRHLEMLIQKPPAVEPSALHPRRLSSRRSPSPRPHSRENAEPVTTAAGYLIVNRIWGLLIFYFISLSIFFNTLSHTASHFLPLTILEERKHTLILWVGKLRPTDLS